MNLLQEARDALVRLVNNIGINDNGRSAGQKIIDRLDAELARQDAETILPTNSAMGMVNKLREISKEREFDARGYPVGRSKEFALSDAEAALLLDAWRAVPRAMLEEQLCRGVDRANGETVLTIDAIAGKYGRRVEG